MASITLDADRRIRADAGRARVAAVGALRGLGFQITSEMATVVEARRGSAVRSAMLMPDQVPLAVRLQFAAALQDAQDTVVSMHLTDRSVSVVALGVQAPYVSAFQSALSALDRALADLDPAAGAGGFPEPRWWVAAPQAEALARHHETGQRLVGGVTARVTDRLSGGPRNTGPSRWTGFDRLVFRSSAGVVDLDMVTARSLLAIPVMIGSRPVELPGQLAFEVQRLAATIEGRLNAGGWGAVEMPVPAEHREAFEFLYRQFEIRSRLPVRTLCVCRDCLQTKVVNLDLKRLRERNHRLKTILSVVRATDDKGEISPFQIFGTLFQQAKFDPDFVCTRCESTEADEQPVTFCPACGDMRKESVLTTCSECEYDFDGLVADLVVWKTAPPPAAPTVPPIPTTPPMPTAPPAPATPPMPTVPPAPATPPTPGTPPAPSTPESGPPPQGFDTPRSDTQGFDTPRFSSPHIGTPRPTCDICGHTYAVLWSVQIPDGPYRRPMTVCATSTRCSPRSLVRPVEVRT
ncbi:hypothetical protein F7Q99_01685 [Streptomyces kaniharaensis]|uniref:Uncharacterized protein n=1 Tax=Streptomyces kaniharaensis TaxID=212423 RepID=A0A6N7KJV3_9ACTN|nr:hypothetical protein [Streptomyces kaniharaensis]MQS11025.1 hypothetical protein [Streptomyces kaniharaensis]